MAKFRFLLLLNADGDSTPSGGGGCLIQGRYQCIRTDSFILPVVFQACLLCAQDRGWCSEYREKPDPISVLWEIRIWTKPNPVLESQEDPSHPQWFLQHLPADTQRRKHHES